MNYLEILERYGEIISDKDRIEKFRTYIYNTLVFYSNRHMSAEYVLSVCQEIGIPMEMIIAQHGNMPAAKHFLQIVLFPDTIYIGNKKMDFNEFLIRISILMQNKFFLQDNIFANWVKKGLDKWNLPYEVCEGIVIPKGVPEFDKALIEDVADWLQKYPDAQKSYLTALRQYSTGEESRDIADNLRKALEAFLQEFLENNKNLDGNISEVGAYLKSHNANEDIRNMFTTIISYYKKLNDKTAKHHGKTENSSVEYLLYQTGVFIRYLIVVKQSGQIEEA